MSQIEYKIGDCLELMKELDGESIDLVVTSPPYPGAKMWSGEGENVQDNIKRLTQLSLEVLKECVRVLKNNSVICWNLQDIPCGNHGVITTTTTTIYASKTLGLFLRGNIIWDKGCPHLPPPPFLKRPVIPNLTHEHILVFYKGDWIPRENTIGMNDKDKQWVAKGVWRIATQSAKEIGHVAPFPFEIARRCIELWSLPNETVFDPFLGSGTTLLACRKTNRNGIGFEINPEYEPIIKKRIMEDIPNIESFDARLED